MARRPTPTNPGTADEPFAWEAREYLRKLLVGRQVLGCLTYTVNSGREYGQILFGSNDPEQCENVAVKLAAEGLVKVRETCNDPALKEAQEAINIWHQILKITGGDLSIPKTWWQLIAFYRR